MIQRLGEVFMMEDVHEGGGMKVAEEDICVKFYNTNFSWGFSIEENKLEKGKSINLKKLAEVKPATKNVLEGLNFKLGPHDTLVVAGKIGCGKTSLLYSIMNETEKSDGKHEVKGSIAYVE